MEGEPVPQRPWGGPFSPKRCRIVHVQSNLSCRPRFAPAADQEVIFRGFTLPRTLAHRRAFLPLALVGVLAATGLGACSSDGSVDAKVVRVVDGDTFEAEYGGQTKTVRLLNVD